MSIKKYVAIEDAKPKRGVYGFKLYRVKNNSLIILDCDGKINYASTRGEESEAMNRLIEIKEIPKKYHGYYYISGGGDFQIQYIKPFNQ